MIRRDAPDGVLAVIKEWHPFAQAEYAVVFDDKPSQTFYEDLLRKGRKDWVAQEWEGDVWATSHLRPICPVCGHPLSQGADAWTRCIGCGAMEPGVSSATMGKRVRTNDPYRRDHVDYTDGHEDDE